MTDAGHEEARTEEAKAHFLRFLDHLDNGNAEEAEKSILAAYAIMPDRLSIVSNLMALSAQNEKYEFVCDVFEKFKAKNEADELCYYNYAISLYNLGRTYETREIIESRLQGIDDSPSLSLLAGDLYFNDDNYSRSLECYQKARLQIKNGLHDSFVENLHNNPHWAEMLEFRIVRNLEALGRYEECWDLACSLNSPIVADTQSEYEKGARLREDLLTSFMQQVDQQTTAIGQDEKGPLSVFILAPSRGGKTTLEQLFSAFEDVDMLGEQNTVRNLVESAAFDTDGPVLDPTAMTDARAKRYAELYGEFIQQNHADKKAIIFTVPTNIYYTGFLAGIEKARFIFLNRNLHDHVFRIFSSFYEKDRNLFCSIDRISQYIQDYHKFHSAISECYPDRSLTLGYEEVIEDPDLIVHRLLEFLRLKQNGKPHPELYDDRDCGKQFVSRMNL